MKSLMLFLAFGLCSLTASASLVAVVDSGTDFDHKVLADRGYINTKEIAGNHIDDDRNGKVDDANGWNFAEGYNVIFYPQHLPSINPITYQLFEIIAHQQAGVANDGEKKFWADHVTSLSPEEKVNLVAHLNFYGQYAHSTHCSGIVAAQAPNAKIISMRVFPDSLPEEYIPGGANNGSGSAGSVGTLNVLDGVMPYLYKMLATFASKMFDDAAVYLKETKADVANYSLGMSLATIAKMTLGLRGNTKPTDAEIAAEVRLMYAQFEPHGRAWMNASPNTLFVIAAGNDGSDNDAMPAYPASVRVDNAITVAASQEYSSLAHFSNYGRTSVDVAAPGVAVISSVPSLDNKTMLPMSGTSMAAPFVSGVAGHIKDVNSALTPLQMKEILMGTVDEKTWLKDKVVSHGVVNPDRAYYAAEKAKTMPLNDAIVAARAAVADRPASNSDMMQVQSFARTPADLSLMANQLVF